MWVTISLPFIIFWWNSSTLSACGSRHDIPEITIESSSIPTNYLAKKKVNKRHPTKYGVMWLLEFLQFKHFNITHTFQNDSSSLLFSCLFLSILHCKLHLLFRCLPGKSLVHETNCVSSSGCFVKWVQILRKPVDSWEVYSIWRPFKKGSLVYNRRIDLKGRSISRKK